MATLRIHAGFRPGDLLLQSERAQAPGVVVLPVADHPTRFSVDQIAGPLFALTRVSCPAWPIPPERETLFVFEQSQDAQAALEALEAALMAEAEPATPTPLPREVKIVAWTATAAAVLACLGMLKNLV